MKLSVQEEWEQRLILLNLGRKTHLELVDMSTGPRVTSQRECRHVCVCVIVRVITPVEQDSSQQEWEVGEGRQRGEVRGSHHHCSKRSTTERSEMWSESQQLVASSSGYNTDHWANKPIRVKPIRARGGLKCEDSRWEGREGWMRASWECYNIPG